MYNEKAIRYYEEARALHHQGRLSAAERTYRKALKADQSFFEAYSNLGNVLVDRGRLREASNAYRKALQISPNHPLLLNNLGNVLQLQGENKKAISWLNKAITQDPGYADAYCNLGNALRGESNFEEAINSYKQAIKNNPDHVEAYVSVGVLLYELDKLDEAIANLGKATEIDPNHIEAIYELGNALSRRNEADKAIASYNRALEIDPGHTATFLELGNTYKQLQQWDKAIDSYEQAIALEPEFVSAYLALSTVRKFEQNEKMVETMERLYQKKDMSSDNLMRLCFALGKAHDDLANYDEAFAYIDQGNQLKRGLLDYDVKSDIAFFEQLASVFQAGTFTGSDKAKAMEITPVFIIGMPRSGKTLSETMLARHPLVFAAGERESLREILNDTGDLRNPGSLVKHILNLSGDEITNLAQKYIDQVRSSSGGEPFIVDTMPTNFYYIGFIKLLFPNAKVIHCYRDPVDACWFIHQKCFRRKSYNYSSDLASLAVYYRGYSDLMAHWHEVLPGYIHDLRYERLITDTQQEMSRLTDFLGLEWDGTHLDQYENKPLHQHDIGVWRHYETHLDPLVKALG